MRKTGRTEILRHYGEALAGDTERVQTALAGLDVAADIGTLTRSIINKTVIGNGNRDIHGWGPLPSLEMLASIYDEQYTRGTVPPAVRELVGRLITSLFGPQSSFEVSGYCIDDSAGFCSLAEDGFYGALRQISGRRTNNWNNRISVYHNAEGKPIFFRKSAGESTALTLESIEVNGLAVAPGTIVSLDPTVSNKAVSPPSGGCTFPGRGISTIATWQLPDTLGIHVGRPSAWSFNDREDRMLFAINQIGAAPADVDKARAAELASTRLDDFRTAAGYLMKLCGVSPQA